MTNVTANQVKSVGPKEPATGDRSSQPCKYGRSHTHHESVLSSPTHRPTNKLVPVNGSKTGKKRVQPEADSVGDTAVDMPEQPDLKEGKEKAEQAKNKAKKPRIDCDDEVEEDSDSELREDPTCSEFVRLTDYIQSG